MTMRVASNDKGNGNGNKVGGGEIATRVMVAMTTVVGNDRARAMVMRVAGNKEGEVGMVMVMVTRMAGK